MMKRMRLVDAATGEVLVAQLEIADSFLRRLVGLMGRPGLAEGEGLVIEPCNGVHSCFMRFPIDVVYVDREWRVIKVDEAMKPWRFGRPVKRSKRVIELPGGAAGRLELAAGQGLNLADPELP